MTTLSDRVPAKRGRLVVSLLIIVLLGCAIFASRAPFLKAMLIGEESFYAMLVLADPPTRVQSPLKVPSIWLAHIDGTNHWGYFQRTSMPYLLLEVLGSGLRQPINLASAPPERINEVARMPFVILYMIGIAGLVALCARAFYRGRYLVGLTATAIVLYTTTCLLSVGSSIQGEIDGSIGILLFGYAALMLASVPLSSAARYWAALVAGFLASLGKQEWMLAALAATLLTLALSMLLHRFGNRVPRDTVYTTARYCAFIVLGMLIGIVVSMMASYDEYMRGWGLMVRVYGISGGNRTAFLHLAQTLSPILVLGGIAGALTVYFLPSLLCTHPGIVILGATGGALVISYIEAGWSGDGSTRYFIIPITLFAFALLGILQAMEREINPRVTVAVLAVFTLACAHNAYAIKDAIDRDISITASYGAQLKTVREHYERVARKAKELNAVVVETPGIALYYPGINVVSIDLGEAGARAFVARVANQYKDKVFRN